MRWGAFGNKVKVFIKQAPETKRALMSTGRHTDLILPDSRSMR